MANNNAMNPPSPGTAEQAINRVLQTERETSQAVADCEQEAHAIRQASRQHARHIHQRTDNRISLIQMSVAQRVTGDIQSMDREENSARHEQSLRSLDETGLSECLDEVARILSGGAPSPVGDGNPGE